MLDRAQMELLTVDRQTGRLTTHLGNNDQQLGVVVLDQIGNERVVNAFLKDIVHPPCIISARRYRFNAPDKVYSWHKSDVI